MSSQPFYQIGGPGQGSVSAAIVATRNPGTSDKVDQNGQPFDFGQQWFNSVTKGLYSYTGGGVWNLVSASTGVVDTLTGTTGTATPTAGNIQIAGTANQITTAASGSTVTLTLPAAITAPGSVTATTTLTATLGAITATNGNLVLNTAGNGIQIKEGSNARMGVATLTAGTVTVSNTSITDNTRVFLTRQSAGASTAIGVPSLGTVVASTSFIINALDPTNATVQTNDVSVIAWQLVEPA